MIRNTFKGIFHITPINNHVDTDLWELRVSLPQYNYFTISAVHTKKKVLECLYNIVRKYKDFKHMERKLKRTEYRHTSDSYKALAPQILKDSKDYQKEVEEVIEQAIADINKTPVKRSRLIKLTTEEDTKESTSPLKKVLKKTTHKTEDMIPVKTGMNKHVRRILI